VHGTPPAWLLRFISVGFFPNLQHALPEHRATQHCFRLAAPSKPRIAVSAPGEQHWSSPFLVLLCVFTVLFVGVLHRFGWDGFLLSQLLVQSAPGPQQETPGLLESGTELPCCPMRPYLKHLFSRRSSGRRALTDKEDEELDQKSDQRSQGS
jgi:hypothetical protein